MTVTDIWGQNVLHAVTWTDHVHTAELLLSLGCDYRKEDKWRIIPALLAVKICSASILDCLLKRDKKFHLGKNRINRYHISRNIYRTVGSFTPWPYFRHASPTSSVVVWSLMALCKIFHMYESHELFRLRHRKRRCSVNRSWAKAKTKSMSAESCCSTIIHF